MLLVVVTGDPVGGVDLIRPKVKLERGDGVGCLSYGKCKNSFFLVV